MGFQTDCVESLFFKEIFEALYWNVRNEGTLWDDAKSGGKIRSNEARVRNLFHCGVHE